MSTIIDQRLNDKNKSTVNRQYFLERYRKHIKSPSDIYPVFRQLLERKENA